MDLDQGVPERPVERVDRTVSFRRAHVALAIHPDLDRGLGLDVAVRPLLDDGPPGLQREQRLVLAALFAQQQLEGPVGGLEVIAAVLERLDPIDHACRDLVVEDQPGVAGARLHGALARQLGDQQLAAVAHHLRVHVLERRRVGIDPRHVHPTLVRERVAPHVRLVGIRREVE